MLVVIIPAHNEAGYIGACLASVFAQEIEAKLTGGLTAVVAANGCTDTTVAEAEAMRTDAEAAGWHLEVLDIQEGGKPNAFNRGDEAAGEMGADDIRVYLDADIEMETPLLAQLVPLLSRPEPAYGSGRMVVTQARSWVTRRFMHLWRRVPYMTASGVTGAGLFAVNAAGRARWGEFPAIIADDTYVRLQFSPEERRGTEAAYFWPPVEGFGALVRVRRRQDAGGREIREKFPQLFENEGKPPVTLADHAKLFAGAPLSYVVYVSVMLMVKFGGREAGWSRGR
jgi:glycosyltransferase involved in cell wall biosynthesis